jgi:hypothetical protein
VSYADFLNLTVTKPPAAFFEPLYITPGDLTVDDIKYSVLGGMGLPASLLTPAESRYAGRRVADEVFWQRLEKVQKDVEAGIFGGYATTCVVANPSVTHDVTAESILEVAKKWPKATGPSRFILRPNRSLGERRQYRFPKSKKRRIRRKWAKRPENYRVFPDPRLYIMDDTIIAHPQTLARLYTALGIEAPRSGDLVIDLLDFQADLLRTLTSLPKAATERSR